jgi:hypothetical protein
MFDRLASPLPTGDPGGHDVDVGVSELFRRDRGGVAGVSKLAGAVEDECRASVSRQVRRAHLVVVEPFGPR